LPGLALSHNTPDLCFLSNKDYTREHLALAQYLNLAPTSVTEHGEEACNSNTSKMEVGGFLNLKPSCATSKTLSQNNQKKEKKSTYIISSKTGEKWGERKRQTEKMGCEVLIPGPAKPSIFWLYRRQ
jgi:hypothetical protein